MKATIYTQSGSHAGELELLESIFGVTWNDQFMHDIVTAYLSNERSGTAHTKDRGEVIGTGKKPWKQKGTGRARHGDKKSPIWVGGGVAHGPKSDKDYVKKINKNAKAKALASVLSKKYSDGELLFVDAFTFSEPKTKQAREVLNALGSVEGMGVLSSRKKNAAVVVLPSREVNTEKSFANFGNITVSHAKDVSILDLLKHKVVVITGARDSLDSLTKRTAMKTARKAITQ